MGTPTSFNPSQQCHLSDNFNFNWCQSVASSDVRKCHQVTSKHEIHRSSQYFPSSSFVWRHSMTSVTSIHHRWWQLTTSTSTDISQSPSSEISRNIWDKRSLLLFSVIISVRRCQKTSHVTSVSDIRKPSNLDGDGWWWGWQLQFNFNWCQGVKIGHWCQFLT